MGNKVLRLKDSKSGGSLVQVVLLSGEIESFKTPVTARTVMKSFPLHLVIHCSAVPAKSSSSRNVGSQRYKVSKTILQPQNSLKADQNYLIVPRSTSSVTIKSIADSWVMFAFNKSAERKKVRRQRAVAKKTKTLTCIRRLFAHIFRVTSPCLLVPDERKRSLSLRYDEPTKETKENGNSNESSKDSRNTKSRRSSPPQADSDSRQSHDRRKLSTWNRLPNACKNAPSRRKAGTVVPVPVGRNWQPSPDLCKGFLIPLACVTKRNRAWKPALSCIPEASSKGIASSKGL